MGQSVGCGIVRIAVFYACVASGCCFVLRELCAYCLSVGVVVRVEYRHIAGVVVDFIGSISHSDAD